MTDLLVVAGARPNFMKVAPMLAALVARGHQGILVHTGQHYDAADVRRLLPRPRTAGAELPPRRRLRVPRPADGAGDGGVRAGLARDETRLVVVVVGDVNSTLACALVAVKLSD